MEEGSRWRIGNGMIVRMLKDKWIPHNGTQLVQDNTSFVDKDLLVSDFIDEEPQCWDRVKVNNYFNPREASKIISIPLSWNHSEDKFIWEAEKNDVYSVKTAYHNLRAKRIAKAPRPSHQMFKGLWKRIWTALVHSKIKNFIWRVAKNYIPVKANLFKKGIKDSHEFPLCHNCVETSEHMFFECNISKLVCFSSPLGLCIPPNTEVLGWLDQ